MASAAASSSGAVVPARLGFLAIYNPSLGSTDDTVDHQIVYYASVTTQAASWRRRRRRDGDRERARPTDGLEPQERNERLRQIGLAQGMVSFGSGFADGAAVDAIDTDRARVIVHELEPGWWILASIDLTKIPLPPRLNGTEETFEYSSREMKPASLLLRDLLRAHSVFLMHHGSSLSALFVHCRRSKFVALLGRYWDLFLSTWNVLLHGNPARDIFGAINVAASGELGVGVGEEDRGSGEREVLEGLVGRIEGLVDLVVSKFGPDEPKSVDGGEEEPWLGTGREPAADDGAVFLGTGALSRKTLRDVTHWMEDLYTWGEHAYGVIESPTSVRRNKARGAGGAVGEAAAEGKVASGPAETESAEPEPEPEPEETITTPEPPEIKATKPAEAETTLEPPVTNTSSKATETKTNPLPSQQLDIKKPGEDGKLDRMLSYMKLGYGSYWKLPGESTRSSKPPAARPTPPSRASSGRGRFLIGLTGDMDEEQVTADDDQGDSSGSEAAEHNSRTVVRTVHVEIESGMRRPETTIVKDFVNPASELTQAQLMGSMLSGFGSHDVNKANKLRVVIYVNQPFILAFFFRLRTDSLAWDTLYRSLHYQLAPLRRPLLSSTRYRPPSSQQPPGGLYSLVWDPVLLTVRAAVPNMPDQQPRLGADSALLDAFWSRADAASTHLQLLLLHAATRSLTGAVERTLKTSRGWWIVWTRLGGQAAEDEEMEAPASSVDGSTAGPAPAKEIFLVRRASDHAGADAVAAAGLAQGIGFDTRRYVEELLSLL
ncbi:vacuolar fusion ccz1 like [Ophiocordyceps camponoti-floridani]|uniref:Vacuolar fusion ccz1 like n=1 Tax=Ophiocordyceps camponoti-floridani TaxID=2030778 RepID=A0A8H4Q9L4_9HYPO|nr:vacuolar fusion ccz1 like [Ophiocordyceps camponoti-floridani]